MPDLRRPGVLEVDPDGTATRPVQRDIVVSHAWEDHHAELYSFLRRATRDESAAEDLLQETFLRLTTEVGHGRPPEHLRAWLYRVASNLATSRGRRRTTALRWLRLHGEHEAHPAAQESAEAGLLRRERTADLESLLESLPADARTALLLSRDGFTGTEIAALIGRSHAATRSLLTRARVHLRLELERQEAHE